MRTEVEAVVDRLRDARSLPWLRVIDDAELDGTAEPEAAASVVVAPYRWLLQRVGDGIRLTQAGYLPPAVVKAAMVELGWQGDWYGAGNREVETPVRELRESAQRFGLLRKNRGQLLRTKLGGRLVDDPSGLWWHLATRLPDGRSDAERQAGILYLLTVAAGRPRDGELLATGMTILGWTTNRVEPVSSTSAFTAAWHTWWVFRWLRLVPENKRWDEPEPPPTEQGRTFARAAILGRTGPVTSLESPPRRKAEQAVQLLVQLRDINPAVWRRLVVPASLTLRELHPVLQTAMGWQDYHLHMFDVDGVLYGDIEDFAGPLGDEERFTVGRAAAAVEEFIYEYDFGDGWTHDIRVEQVMPMVGSGTPHLLGGSRACPPEDCGGPGGYHLLLAALQDPGHEDHERLLGWVGGDFDAEAFDLAEINANLELYDRHTRQRWKRSR